MDSGSRAGYLVCFGLAAAFAQGSAGQSTDTGLPREFRWTASAELILPPVDPSRKIFSIKDPSVVRFNDRWHVYATISSDRGWQMVYLNFENWEDAKHATPYFLDTNPRLRGYHCAPQVFYFSPHKKWYLIYQSQHPQYSTSDDLADPASWSEPRNFFENKPATVGDLWIDYWIICDDTHAYLFFTGDDGRFYR
ncbi:MAG: non-reducing end alpha-L-arabinofuranosidase family hydrolase, partial [Phycisphaerae bacterium]|nr:non-reducing end alpha-L-arabinofuranosidase family hydrolase [Phycisphaerae bacterium]